MHSVYEKKKKIIIIYSHTNKKMGAITRLIEGIVVLISIILIVIGLGLMFLEQKWLNGFFTFISGGIILGIRIAIHFALKK
jgi:hypothetical protein